MKPEPNSPLSEEWDDVVLQHVQLGGDGRCWIRCSVECQEVVYLLL